MKKLSIVLVLTLVFILLAHPGFSASLRFDFNGDEVWDDLATLSNPGDTLEVDVWLADCNDTVSSVDYEIYFDNKKLAFNQTESYPYDTSQGGVWTPGAMFSNIIPPTGSIDNIRLLVTNFSGVVVSGKVKLHRVVFNAIYGESTIGTDDEGVYTNGMWQPVDIGDNAEATIYGPCVITINPDSAEVFPGDTVQFSATEEGNCGTASYTWGVTGGCGSSINASGLYTAGNISDCADTVTVTDTANGNIQDTATVTIQTPLTIEPENPTIGAGGKICFQGATDMCSDPIYTWLVESSGGYTGSTINAMGCYRARRDVSQPPACMETIDTVHLEADCSGDKKTTETNVTVTPCLVTISPGSAQVETGETILFTATGNECCVNDPCYTWDVSAAGTTGNTTNTTKTNVLAKKDNSEPAEPIYTWSLADMGATGNTGNTFVFQAGSTVGTVMVEVTDTCNNNSADTVTVEVSGTSTTTTTIGACAVTISPRSETVPPYGTIQFSAGQSGNCKNPCYDWEIMVQGSTGSTIDANGLYRAGSNEGTDEVQVTDTCNNDVSDIAIVDVNTSTSTSVPVGPGPQCQSDADCLGGNSFCDGIARCVAGRCQPGSDPCPDDGLYCNGKEGCDEEEDVCTQSGDPCIGTEIPICDEEIDTCVECLSDADCEGGSVCSDEGVCVEPPPPSCVTDADCDDGAFCNGEEICVAGRCQTGSDPCPDDELFCNGEEGCDEEEDVCTQSGDPCIGTETPDCNEVEDICQPEPPLPLEFDIFPKSALRSHIVPLPLVMFIVSADSATEFNRGSTEVSVDDALTPPLTIVLSKNAILTISLITPGEIGTTGSTGVNVTVTTDAGEGTEILTLNMLPLFLSE